MKAQMLLQEKCTSDSTDEQFIVQTYSVAFDIPATIECVLYVFPQFIWYLYFDR